MNKKILLLALSSTILLTGCGESLDDNSEVEKLESELEDANSRITELEAELDVGTGDNESPTKDNSKDVSDELVSLNEEIGFGTADKEEF